MKHQIERQTLESLADRIEATLARQKISIRITGGLVSPDRIQFQALPALGARLEKADVLLAAALGVNTCHVTIGRGMVLIEIPRPAAQDGQPTHRPVRLSPPVAQVTELTLLDPSLASLFSFPIIHLETERKA